MESPKVPIEKIVAGLKLDRHTCNKELFAFVNRSLMNYGLQARLHSVEPDFVSFNIVEMGKLG